jgi:hypothetical protein
MSRTQRGVTLVELLVSLLMTIILSGALFSIFTNTYESRDFVVGQGGAETDARTPLDNLADHLRDAQQYWTTGAVAPTSSSQSSVIAAGTATSVTYYESNNATDTVRLWLNGTDLDRTVAGTTTTLIKNVKSLVFTYYVAPSTAGVVNYNNPGQLLTTANASAPVAAELPFISQINIDATVNESGYQRELTCTVRLRNSPYKLHL